MSARDLEGSVHEITNRADSNVPSLTRAEVDKLGMRLEQIRREFARVEQDLISLCERETYDHEIGGRVYVGKAQQIAQRVEQERERLGWIADNVDADADAPLSDQEFVELVNLWKVDFGALLNGAQVMSLPKLGELPQPPIFHHLCIQLLDWEERIMGFAEVMRGDPYQKLLHVSAEQVSAVREALEGLTTALAVARNHRLPWVEGAINQVTTGSSNYWADLYEGVEEELSDLAEATREVVEHELPEVGGQNPVTVIGEGTSFFGAHPSTIFAPEPNPGIRCLNRAPES